MELRRVPKAIPFARYSTPIASCAHYVDTVCKWKRKWKASTHFRTDVKAHAHCPPLSPLPYYSPSCFLALPTPPTLSLLLLLFLLSPPPRPLSFEAPSEAKERRDPAIASIMLNSSLANVTLAHIQWNARKEPGRQAGNDPGHEIYHFNVTNGIFDVERGCLPLNRPAMHDRPNFANVQTRQC